MVQIVLSSVEVMLVFPTVESSIAISYKSLSIQIRVIIFKAIVIFVTYYF
jgi:hypothetical protein